MENSMLAAVYKGTPEIELIETKIPEIRSNEVLLKVNAAGICGTDLRILKSGHRRIPDGARIVLGHEVSGEIAGVGSQVIWPKVGMRISVAPNMGCGYCGRCVQGFTQLCGNYFSFGVVIDGAFAQYMRIPSAAIEQGNLAEIAEHVTYEEAAMVEPLSCVFRGLMACRPQPSETVLIIGAGAIGLMFVQLAKMLGARVIVSSRNDERSQQSKRFGADLTFNPKEEDFHEAVFSATGGQGADIAIVAAPSSQAQTNAIEVLAHHGRVNFFGGLPQGNEITPVNANMVHYKELFITGTTGSSIREYRTALSLVDSGQVEVASLVTHRFPLGQIAEAFQVARSKEGIKTIVLPNY
ncbi:MAG: zinc-binding dehydrogenase [Proteobacteria bacterium]|nr:zinc-binding dehydrogenase [Pseudomonadota bacterium]